MNEPDRQIEYLNSPKEMPEGLSDEEQIEFWETHGLSEEYLQKTEDVSEDDRPRPRTKPINVRFDDFTLNRLKALADSRNVGYQTLLKTFVQERLYEEEKRQGAIKGRNEPVVANHEPKKVDLRNEAHNLIKENKEVLEDPDVTSIALSRLASDAASLLKRISVEIKDNSRKKNFPPAKLNRQVKAYEALKPFVERSLSLYEEKFGTDDDYDVVAEARQILTSAGRG